jgi:uncharacterized membrane protein
MAKTASFGVLHLATAFSISYALTGSLAISGAITVLEPLANTVMHYFHDKHWPAFEAWFKDWWHSRRSKPRRASEPAPQHSA